MHGPARRPTNLRKIAAHPGPVKVNPEGPLRPKSARAHPPLRRNSFPHNEMPLANRWNSGLENLLETAVTQIDGDTG